MAAKAREVGRARSGPAPIDSILQDAMLAEPDQSIHDIGQRLEELEWEDAICMRQA